MKLRDDVLDWLLEEDNPPVRYLTLTRLLDRPQRSREVVRAKAHLMEYEVTREILRHGDEFWPGEEWPRSYQKYRGRFWQLIFLGHFLADGRDPGIAEGVQKILEARNWIMKIGGQCLTSNVLGAMYKLGYRDEPLVRDGMEDLAEGIVRDQGLNCDVMNESLLVQCYMAQPKLLLCFAQIPPSERSPSVQSAIAILVKRLVENEVFIYVPGNKDDWLTVLATKPKKEDLPRGELVKDWVLEHKAEYLAEHGPGERHVKAGWAKFGFPLHYNSDALEAMYALAQVDTPMSPRLEAPLQLIRDKMTPEGKWKMESSLNGKMWVNVEKKGKPSKWVTFFALSTLRHFEA
ncbi:MAG: hypothetical protein JSU96_08590 [Acidobacteriota bacterium]|nr:MAG: hypothetical protein JSU96_08590 [Acidobacteriota bacterium]